MTNHERAQDLQEMVARGQMVEAIDKYFADDVSIVEADGQTFSGRETQKERVRQWQQQMVREVHGTGAHSLCMSASGDTAMIESWVDATFADGNRMTFEEVIVQSWGDNGKVTKERYYYYVPAEAQQTAG